MISDNVSDKNSFVIRVSSRGTVSLKLICFPTFILWLVTVTALLTKAFNQCDGIPHSFLSYIVNASYIYTVDVRDGECINVEFLPGYGFFRTS